VTLVILQGMRKNKNVVQINKNDGLWRKSLRTSLNKAWNTAGALVKPKGITRYSK